MTFFASTGRKLGTGGLTDPTAIEVNARSRHSLMFIGKTAGNGNRTRIASLEGWNFTIKLCPRDVCIVIVNGE